MVRVSYHAQEQVKRLSPQEQRELARVLERGEVLDRAPDLERPDRFVSRLGADKRVVWEKADGGDVVVLAVVSKQSAQ